MSSYWSILASSVGRASVLKNSRSQVQTSVFLFFSFLSSLFLLIIAILDYCKMDCKVFIFANNKFIYLEAIESIPRVLYVNLNPMDTNCAPLVADLF